MQSPSAIILGGGSTGTALAYDLALRGVKVTLLERGEIASGTTGRNHCLLHSGARYCVTDPDSARECYQENLILRRILPGSMELNGGLFIALDDRDMSYLPEFLEGCEQCGIPVQQLTSDQALQIEPNLNPNLLAAILVPDGVFEPYRLCLSFLASAIAHGATVHTHTLVQSLIVRGKQIVGCRVLDHKSGQQFELAADIVINAAGAWAGQIAAMAGVPLPVIPAPGVMISMRGRYCERVVNRLNRPDDGDIIVPQRQTSIIGTTSWITDNPDNIDIPLAHVQRLLQRGTMLIPALQTASPRGIFAVARPLIGTSSADERSLTRSFACFDHTSDGIQGFISLIGGKTTTARRMAEAGADMVCRIAGHTAICQTDSLPLRSYREFHLRSAVL
jgi:glycerol-3-phosphate dehydrogenase